MQAVDLDGLEAFIVHGTTQGQSGVKFTQAAIDQFKRLTGNSQVDDNDLSNSLIYHSTWESIKAIITYLPVIVMISFILISFVRVITF